MRTVGSMPTAEDYRAGITDLGRRLEDVGRIHAAVDRTRDDFGFTGGVAWTIEDAMIASAANASSIGAHGDGLIAEMQRRARLCDQYTIAMRVYDELHRDWRTAQRHHSDATAEERIGMTLGAEPARPEPPFLGAEVSR